jgi:peptide-methionine (R)-S-oxide reductase
MAKDMRRMGEDFWKEKLSEEQYRVLRQAGTEPAFTGKYNFHKEKGMYVCGACGAELFSSDVKYDSDCGWPSFYDITEKDNIKLLEDTSAGMIRTEVRCKNCGSHLGHLFDDGPNPPGSATVLIQSH